MVELISKTSPVNPATLDLHGQSTSVKELTQLAEKLKNDCQIRRVVLADSFLGDEGCILLAGALRSNCSVQYLDLRGNSIRNDGAAALAQMLKVNTALKSLILEWNCIGIWESGIRVIADALGINQSLEELDLRNNKIGPQGAQTLAVCLRNNSGLRKLDLRWNNIGLLGSRAFMDLLKWNETLEELLLAGNEVPEDIALAITTALERNRTSHATSIHARLQADHIHSLTTAHQDTVATLSRELAAREHQLTLQSSELSKSRDSFRGLETRADRLEREKRELEQKWMEERSILEKKCVELEERLRHDREERLHRNRDADAAARHAQKRLLELEAQVADSELKVEVVNRDKKMLLEEVEKLRGKLKIIKQEADEKVAKAESDAEERWTRVIKDRVSKVDEKLKASEASRVKLEEEFDLAKTRWLAEKRSLQDKAMDTEARVRREEDEKRADLTSQIQSLNQQLKAVQTDLATRSTGHATATRNYEAERDKWQQQRGELLDQITLVKARQTELETSLAAKEAAQRESKRTEQKLSDVTALCERHRLELSTLHEELAGKDRQIANLKQEIYRKNQELDEKDDENLLQMKELQLSIASLMNARTKRHRVRSTDISLT